MAVTMQSVIVDIEAETAALRELIAPLPEGPRGWDAPTPAVGWAIRDQISHLAFFDDVAVRSATTTSQAATMPVPPPTHAPWTSATVGLSHS